MNCCEVVVLLVFIAFIVAVVIVADVGCFLCVSRFGVGLVYECGKGQDCRD